MKKDEASQTLQKAIIADITYYASIAKLLRGVKQVYKKDGTQFANIKKGLALDKEIAEEYQAFIQWEESPLKGDARQNLKINYKTPDNKTHTLYFNAYKNITERDPEYVAMEQAGRLVESMPGLKDYYLLTAEELIANFKAEADKTEARANYLYATMDDTLAQGLKIYDLLTELENTRKSLSDDWTDPTAVNRYHIISKALKPLFDNIRY